jgi:hypothetical protein
MDIVGDSPKDGHEVRDEGGGARPGIHTSSVLTPE